jgi:hypothetical protein
VFGVEWFNRVKGLGALDADVEHYVTVMKKVSDQIKVTGLDDPNWILYVENSTLAGYRNPPFPGFSLVREAEELAHSGVEHNYFGSSWESLMEEFIPLTPPTVEYIKFNDWVEAGSWVTPGASSVGRVELEFPDGSVRKVKARKTNVPDVLDLSELAREAISSPSQVNVAITKAELGKIRIAVAGDMSTYLKMAWIDRLLGGSYYAWEGNTSEEDFHTQTQRMHRMLKLAVDHFGLPYDYAKFDHQPTTVELVGIVSHLCSAARVNVPLECVGEFESIVASVVNGFHSSTLLVKDPETTTFEVTGGLMSGLRWTSVIGNAWNSLMTGLVMRVLRSNGVLTDELIRYIRGDDSAIFSPTWEGAACVHLGYQLVGAKAGEGKFSIRRNAMEFLRVWYADRCYGYPARALPGLTQRKPWTSEPWTATNVMEALHDAVCTLRRRLPDPTTVEPGWQGLKRIWARDHNLSMSVFSIPKFAGGLGIEPPRPGLKQTVSPPIPAVPSPEVRLRGQTSYRRDKMSRQYRERYGTLPDPTRLDEAVAQATVSSLTTDSFPAVVGDIRVRWKTLVRTQKSKVITQPLLLDHAMCGSTLNTLTPDNYRQYTDTLQAQNPMYGSVKNMDTILADYRLSGESSFRSWLKQHWGTVYLSLYSFHSSWHMGDRIRYLSGKMQGPTSWIHPQLTWILGLVTAARVRPKSRVDRVFPYWYAAAFERDLYHSPLSTLLYKW